MEKQRRWEILLGGMLGKTIEQTSHGIGVKCKGIE